MLFFVLNSPFKLATCNVQMLIGRQGCLGRTLETLAIELCCIQEIHSRLQIYHSTYIPIQSFGKASSVPFWDPEAANADLTSVYVALIESVEVALFDCILVSSWLRSVRFGISCRPHSRYFYKRSLLVVSVRSCRLHFRWNQGHFHKMPGLLCTATRYGILFLAGGRNARVGGLSLKEVHLMGSFSFSFCRLNNEGRLLAQCWDHWANHFRHSSPRHTVWRQSVSSQRWSQIEDITMNYQ